MDYLCTSCWSQKVVINIAKKFKRQVETSNSEVKFNNQEKKLEKARKVYQLGTGRIFCHIYEPDYTLLWFHNILEYITTFHEELGHGLAGL